VEHERPIFLLQVLVEPDSRRGTGQHALKRRLSLGERFAPHVGPVELDQVEVGPHEHAVVAVPSPDQLKISDPIITAGDGFAIDDAGSGAQPRKSLDDQGEARRQIVELHPDGHFSAR